MLKKILIGFGILALVVVLGMVYLKYRGNTLSPPGSASLTAGELTVSVTYGRPSVRDRLIFGSKEQGALQPYGAYWRLGANESTEITFKSDVNFNGQPVKAGTYRMYAVPGPETFEIALNSELGKWGAFEPDYSLDILRTNVPVEKADAAVEQHTIRLEPIEGGINVVFEWSDARWVVPVTVQ